MPVKKITSKKTRTTSLRAIAKQSSSDKIPNKIATKPSASRNDKLSIPIYSLTGRASGNLSLPKEVFGVKVNEKLLAQAMRVYMTNQKVHTASTKTRGEVRGSTAKIYRQKGTGRARHGAIRAPIFVGGGIVFGPRPRKVSLDLPKKMKKAALLSALSSKMVDKNIVGLVGLEKASGKTKEMAKLVNSLWLTVNGKDKKTINHKQSALIVTGEKTDNVVRAVRNIPGINVLPANLINAYEVLKHELLLVTKGAVDKLMKPQVKE